MHAAFFVFSPPPKVPAVGWPKHGESPSSAVAPGTAGVHEEARERRSPLVESQANPVAGVDVDGAVVADREKARELALGNGDVTEAGERWGWPVFRRERAKISFVISLGKGRNFAKISRKF